MESTPQGVLLINLGTPDAPETGPVRRYLREFLSDPRVLDIPPAGRAALLYGIILPFRPQKSAEAYRKIWMPQGSPLLVHGKALRDRLQDALGPAWAVELGMRYGKPSLGSALEALRARGVRELSVVPLYPQYASSSTGSSLERVFKLVGEAWNVEAIRVLPPFYDRPAFLDAFADVARPILAEARPDHVLFSFHGLPERQVKKSDPTGAHCLARADCCDVQVSANRWCYRMQAVFTARALAQRLALEPGKWTVTFQSRLGRTPWIKPYTDLVIPELARAGAKGLAVFCPAFVADCLETLEEIGIRAKEQFLAHGGEALTLVPSLNAHPSWVRGLTQMVRQLRGDEPISDAA
ncbi:MAG TPA: ferrochelatase [Myxococcaceae bacterium]|nr:ferrochelatase [Myxococcaceae bacterium]